MEVGGERLFFCGVARIFLIDRLGSPKILRPFLSRSYRGAVVVAGMCAFS